MSGGQAGGDNIPGTADDGCGRSGQGGDGTVEDRAVSEQGEVWGADTERGVALDKRD